MLTIANVQTGQELDAGWWGRRRRCWLMLLMLTHVLFPIDTHAFGTVLGTNISQHLHQPIKTSWDDLPVQHLCSTWKRVSQIRPSVAFVKLLQCCLQPKLSVHELPVHELAGVIDAFCISGALVFQCCTRLSFMLVLIGWLLKASIPHTLVTCVSKVANVTRLMWCRCWLNELSPMWNLWIWFLCADAKMLSRDEETLWSEKLANGAGFCLPSPTRVNINNISQHRHQTAATQSTKAIEWGRMPNQ